jgi:hypothetical protein
MLLLSSINLQSAVKVISHRQHEGIGIILQMEGIGKESNCPRCEKKSYITSKS